MKELNKEARTFDELSERYERWFSEGEGELVKDSEALAIEKLIPEGEGLEVGVGSGIFASELEVDFGVDPAEKLLRTSFTSFRKSRVFWNGLGSDSKSRFLPTFSRPVPLRRLRSRSREWTKRRAFVA